MLKSRKKGLFESTRVQFLPVKALRPNPNQPRHTFEPEALEELAESIRLYGILQPLSVRRLETGFELVSGERRLRAAVLAGLSHVPCILVEVDSEASSLLALVENLQRRDLDFVEEAAALASLIHTYGLSQEEAARRIGKSQSAVANKLRLLRLPPEVLSLLRENRFTERHARTLLRLPTPEAQLEAARYLVDHRLTVAAAEEYVSALLTPSLTPPVKRRPVLLLRDVRLFLNSVTRGLSLMKDAGLDAACDRQDTEDAILLTIKIPKQTRS